MIQTFGSHKPKIADTAFVHETAVIIGQVEIACGASIWPNVVLRGDMGLIRIGKNSSIQDGSICHMTSGYSQTIVGDNVTVGHAAILHGCIIENGCLIGMGSIVLDNTTIGRNSFVAAGSLITGNKVFAPNSFICGSPAKMTRAVSDKEKQMCAMSAQHYKETAEQYRKMNLTIER